LLAPDDIKATKIAGFVGWISVLYTFAFGISIS